VLFAIVVAALIAAIAGCGVVIVQSLIQRAVLKESMRMRQVTELARRAGGIVTPLGVAQELSITPLDADRLLRSMVDDEHLSMDIDVDKGELRFWFTHLATEPDKDDARAKRRSSGRPSARPTSQT
jgi:hypothetical protein